MRKSIIAAAAIATISVGSYADLQNVEVGGGIRIRGNSYLGGAGGLHPDVDGFNSQFTEQRTNLNVKADFSDEVSAFIEFDSYGAWGDETRDGLNGPVASEGFGDVSLYQAYIQLGSAWDSNFDIKIGRQEVMLGTEWLIGNKSTASAFNQMAFDGITAKYNADTYSVTLLSLKLAEVDASSAFLVADFIETDRDSDMYGAYLSYTGNEDMTIDGYVFYNRIGQGVSGGNPDGDSFDLFTIGGRIGGVYGGWDYEVELAYQTGDTGFETGAGDDIDAEGLGGHFEVGYTFDTNLAPRVYGGVAYFEGGDDDGESTGFNRLYSDWEYSEFLSNANLNNAIVYRAGVSAEATEKIGLLLALSMFQLEDDEAVFTAGGPFAGFAGNDEDDLGFEVGLYGTYQYSEDVAFEVGYAHFFNGDFIEDALGGDDDDPDYVYAEVSLSF